MKYISIILLILFSYSHSLAQNKWVQVGATGNDAVICMYSDTVAKKLYVGGSFTSIGGISANCIAKYNGQTWNTLGSGTNGEVFAIVAKGSKVYVGGTFTLAGGVAVSNIAVYDTATSTWSSLGTGANSGVNALIFYNNELYAGGWFTTMDGVTVNGISRWDGTNWHSLGVGLDGVVHTCSIYNNQLYVAGAFSMAGATSANNISYWDGAQWYALTTGTDFDIKHLYVYNNGLYVGGAFATSGDTLTNGIAKWNGISWSRVSTGTGYMVNSIINYDSLLFLGGNFSYVGGIYDPVLGYLGGGLPANNIAAWNGSVWDSISNGFNGYVNTLAKFNSIIYAGGAFQYSGNDPVSYLAKWCDVNASASSNVTICAGKSTTLTASGGDTYSWSSGGTSSSIVVSPTVTTTYTATVSKNGCSDTAMVNVFVNSLPTVLLSGNTTICNGTSSTLSVSGGISYSWNTGSTATSIVVSPTTQTNYSVTATDANNCSASKTTTVVVNSLPTASISGNTTICNGGSSTLTASGGVSYSWNTGSTATAIVVAPTTQTDYSVTVTDANSCSSIKTTTVVISTVNPSITGNTTICNGGSSTLTASGGVSYSWNTGSTATSIVVAPTTQTDYSVTVTDAYNCFASKTTTVIVNSLPIPSITGNTTICNGSSSTLTASGGVSYSWNTGSTATAIVASPTTQTNYSVVVTDVNDCSTSTSSTVYVNNTPDFTFFFSDASCSACCDGLATINNPGGTAPYTYSWNTSPAQTTGTATGLCVGNYTATVTDANGCTSSNVVSISFSTDVYHQSLAVNKFSVEISPNPFTEQSKIVINDFNSTNNYQIQLFDICGKKIKQFRVNTRSFILERSELERGIYFIKIVSEASNNIITRKLIIE